jgi:hypothetical protein
MQLITYIKNILDYFMSEVNIIHRPIFYLKYGVSEARFPLRFQVEPTQLSPIDRDSLCR